MSLCTLIYHNIFDDDADLAYDPFGIAVTRSTFVSHLKMLKSRYQLVSQAQITEAISPGTVLGGRDCILLTIDDGYAQGILTAAEVLREIGGRALAFISPAHIDSAGHRYWWDILADGMASGRISVSEGMAMQGSATRMPYIEAEEFVRGVTGGDVGCSKRFELARWETLRIAHDVFDYGVHGLRHDCFSAVHWSQLGADLTKAKERLIAENCGAPVALAYPYGDVAAVTKEQVEHAVANQFELAFTATKGAVVDQSRSNVLFLPRCFVSNCPSERLNDQIQRRFSSALQSQ